jgi:signal transduction histidine kinase/ActR/RegA family two-component response regulator
VKPREIAADTGEYMRSSSSLPAPLQPLRRKLPLLITVLLFAVVGVFGWLAHLELVRVFESVAQERLVDATQRVATILDDAAAAIRRQLDAVAGDRALADYLGQPTPANRQLAERVLSDSGRASTTKPSRALWTRDCRLVLSVGPITPRSAAESCPDAVDAAQNGSRQTWVRPFSARRDSVRYEIVAPVVRGRDTLGFVVETRGLASGQGVHAIEGLIGRNVSMLVGNADGPTLWTDLLKPVTAPPVAAREARRTPVEFRHPDGTRHLGFSLGLHGAPWLVWVQLPLDAAIEPERRTMHRLELLALVCVLFGALGAWMVSTHVTRPLAELTGAADDLAGGDYGRRVSTARQDEIGQLMRAFNRMAAQVESARTELHAQAEELEHHVREAQDLAHELELSNQELLESSEEIKVARRDITAAESLHHELEAQLLQAQKMEAVGRLAGGIAHDFNNLLTVITSYTTLALETVAVQDPLHGDLGEIHTAALRAAGLTKQLLAFSRKQVMQPEVLRLNVVASEMERMLRRLIGEDVTLTLDLANDLGEVYADRGQLEQVIMNLAVNARDAMPDGGHLVIETSNNVLTSEYSIGELGAPAGEYVTLSVSDTGTGISAETQAHIFEPFFTTKPTGEGTGLGLATVYGIVKQSGGDIKLRSELGGGTTFVIYLPRLRQAEAHQARRSPAGGVAHGGSETILLVEDDVSLRHLALRVLRRVGYTVLEAQSSRQAIALGASHPYRIDLLLTDVVMPDLSGRTVAERLTAHRPDLRVLYMSGYTDDDVMRRGITAVQTQFIQKPFLPDALVRRVREALDASPPSGGTTRATDIQRVDR